MRSTMRILVVLTAVVGAIFATFASSALAKSTYGQCGPAVHNGSQLVNAWGAMGVLNSPAASSIAKSAGWKPMDGGMVSFMVQRGREFKLARPANVQDFGCRYGSMYSVGVRHYGAGESVIGIVPAQYSPNQIAGHPRKGYHKILMWLRTVGRANCSNGFQARVIVIAYVPNKHTPVPHKPKPAPKPKPKPKPQPAPKGPAAACITSAGVPLYSPLPSGVTVVNGVCTTTTTVTTQTCKEGQTVSHDSNGNMICIQNTNTNTNTITVPVTVVVTPPAPVPCGCTPPPAPTPTPPPPVAPSVTITSTTTLNDIPEGKNSGPFYITVNASAAGSLTLDPGIGGVSDCSSSTPQGSITLNFAAGNSPLCVILYAPTDASANQMTITETAIVNTSGGTAKDVKSQTFTISHPTRPA